MSSICFYFQVHQPFRVRPYTFDEIGLSHFYEDFEKNKAVMNKVADKCYLPANAKMLELIKRFDGKFKISYSISGTALEQFELYRPDVLESFKKLADTGCVEILGETYYHSLSFIHSKNEFQRQVTKHSQRIKKLFGIKPKVFRNTELIYSNEVAQYVSEMGFRGILCEGVDRLLDGRTPNHVFASPGIKDFGVLLKNYKLSDDIAFRFSNKEWEEFPLTSDKFAHWIHSHAGNSETINLFMDYETFGEHQWSETGIFNFLDYLPGSVLRHPDFNFKTPSEVLESYPCRDTYHVPDYISWADSERDLSAWMENKMQHHSLQRIYALESKVLKTKNEDLITTWRKLQTSDHFYYMCTKFWSDGDVHKYFSPYDSPFDAHLYYMNALTDFELTVKAYVSVLAMKSKKKPILPVKSITRQKKSPPSITLA